METMYALRYGFYVTISNCSSCTLSFTPPSSDVFGHARVHG